jgi:hypothetical protein
VVGAQGVRRAGLGIVGVGERGAEHGREDEREGCACDDGHHLFAGPRCLSKKLAGSKKLLSDYLEYDYMNMVAENPEDVPMSSDRKPKNKRKHEVMSCV